MIKKNKSLKGYNYFRKTLSDYWKQDITKDDYDYEKYYNDDPLRAITQLNQILRGNTPHFPDDGKSGYYKKRSHPTYPDRGINSWNKEETIFYPSDRQMENSDKILDYLGIDYNYNNGATKAVYNGGTVLPTIYVTPRGNYTNLIPNKKKTGYIYNDRK